MQYNNVMTSLSIEYRGADLTVQVEGQDATLLINNRTRETKTATTKPVTLTLSSTVQTDYEWHEFIEAEINLDQDSTAITLRANSQTLVHETFSESGA